MFSVYKKTYDCKKIRKGQNAKVISVVNESDIKQTNQFPTNYYAFLEKKIGNNYNMHIK